MVKEIPLTQGKVAVVDDDDFERVSQFKWHSVIRKKKRAVYASHSDYVKGTGRNGEYFFTYLHHFIVGYPISKKQIDHINGNGLDNRKENLRIVSNRQNSMNRHHEKKSQYPGVILSPPSAGCTHKKWTARIYYNGKNHSLGYFFTEEDAFTAYKKALGDIGEEIYVPAGN